MCPASLPGAGLFILKTSENNQQLLKIASTYRCLKNKYCSGFTFYFPEYQHVSFYNQFNSEFYSLFPLQKFGRLLE